MRLREASALIHLITVQASACALDEGRENAVLLLQAYDELSQSKGCGLPQLAMPKAFYIMLQDVVMLKAVLVEGIFSVMLFSIAAFVLFVLAALSCIPLE